jgi:predicted transcriptional regulator
VPAVSIRRSVQRDYVVCLDYRAKMLRRHLTAHHRLTVNEYRTRWDLPAAHPPYSERRSTMAKAIGLGQRAASSASY